MSSSKKYELSFFTATILEWNHLLTNDDYKQLIVDSLKFFVDKKRIDLYAFVIMNNHIHLLWNIIHPHKLEEVKRDLLRFTAKMIIKDLRSNHPEILKANYVNAADREYQIWERNPLNIEIWTEDIMMQKLKYIHYNPVKKGLCIYPEDYKYSSAAFYNGEMDRFEMLTACTM